MESGDDLEEEELGKVGEEDDEGMTSGRELGIDLEEEEDEEEEVDEGPEFSAGARNELVKIGFDELHDEVHDKFNSLAGQIDDVRGAMGGVNQAMERRFEKYAEEFEQLRKQLENSAGENVQRVNEDVANTVAKNEAFVENIKLEFEQEVKNRKRNKSDFSAEMKNMKEVVSSHLRELENFLLTFNKITDVVAYLIEDTQMQQALELQDERDKTTIALYGMRQDELYSQNSP